MSGISHANSPLSCRYSRSARQCVYCETMIAMRGRTADASSRQRIPNFPQRTRLQRAATLLRQGGIVAFPTETVYGLGADALDTNAVARIFKAKQRPNWDPLIVHVRDLAMARSLAKDFPATLADKF